MDPRICVIGAGPSGITSAKNMLAEGFQNLVVYELSDQVGGNWVFREEESHSSVCETTHIISSRRWSGYEDFPMPDHYPDYPGHALLREYFQSYAAHFGVNDYIQFNTRVVKAARRDDGKWVLQVHGPDGPKTEVFDYLLVASGHHWDPRIPSYPGTFDGEILHSHHYKKADPYRGKRVLVVGGGNSACDTAVETARVARKVCISMRRGQHIIPKFMFGLPSDTVYTWTLWVPRFLRQHLLALSVWAWQGSYKRYGLQKPERPPLEMHPTLNSELLYFIRHGEVHPRKGIERFDGKTVHFVDGTADQFDVVIYCTGFRTSFPFFDLDFVDYRDATEIPLYRKMIHGDYDNLFFIGLFQPLGCIWPLADHQARIAALQIAGRWKRPHDLKQRIEQEVRNPHFNFEKRPRHATEVDYHQFRKELLKELARVS